MPRSEYTSLKRMIKVTAHRLHVSETEAEYIIMGFLYLWKDILLSGNNMTFQKWFSILPRHNKAYRRVVPSVPEDVIVPEGNVAEFRLNKKLKEELRDVEIPKYKKRVDEIDTPNFDEYFYSDEVKKKYRGLFMHLDDDEYEEIFTKPNYDAEIAGLEKKIDEIREKEQRKMTNIS